MPIHEYRCEPCGARFEILVRHDNPPVCPTCGSTTLERQLSVFATPGDGGAVREPMADCASMAAGQGCACAPAGALPPCMAA